MGSLAISFRKTTRLSWEGMVRGRGRGYVDWRSEAGFI